MGGGKKARQAKSSGVKQTSSQIDKAAKKSLDPVDGSRDPLESVAQGPAAAATAAAAAAPEEPQTYPSCTVQMEAQFAFALSNDKIMHQLQRLFDSVHKSLLVAPGADTSGFLDTVSAKVSEGAADQEIYQALRLLVHPDKDASPPVEESSTIDRARARDRAQKRCTKALCMLRASPEWGQRRPTAILDVGCGRDVFFAAALGEALGAALDDGAAPIAAEAAGACAALARLSVQLGGVVPAAVALVTANGCRPSRNTSPLAVPRSARRYMLAPPARAMRKRSASPLAGVATKSSPERVTV
jgi:hypothetical protein